MIRYGGSDSKEQLDTTQTKIDLLRSRLSRLCRIGNASVALDNKKPRQRLHSSFKVIQPVYPVFLCQIDTVAANHAVFVFVFRWRATFPAR